MHWIFVSRTNDGGTLYQHEEDDWVYLVIYKHKTRYDWYVYEHTHNGFSSPLMSTNRLLTIKSVFKEANRIATSWRNRF